MIEIICGDASEVLPDYPENTFDACFCDPPYGLGFMGEAWDHGVPSVEVWRGVYRILKPGAMLMAFGGARTWHRLACAIEDAGFEMRDTMMWLYGSGFPKSLDISKKIDKRGGVSVGWFGPWLRRERVRCGIAQKDLAKHFPSKTGGLTGCIANWELGLNMPTPEQFNTLCEILSLPFGRIEEAEREIVDHNDRPAGWFTSGDGHEVTAPATDAARLWSGYGTALKPAWEPILLAMKPCEGTFAENALKWGVAGLAIDAGRIGTTVAVWGGKAAGGNTWNEDNSGLCKDGEARPVVGRWPANLLLDEEAAAMLDEQSGDLGKSTGGGRNVGGLSNTHHKRMSQDRGRTIGFGDSGGASRFFYCAKASRNERGEGNAHPTVKPLALCEYLARLILPPDSGFPRALLNPFAGSGSEAIGADRAGWDLVVSVEISPEYAEIARRRSS